MRQQFCPACEGGGDRLLKRYSDLTKAALVKKDYSKVDEIYRALCVVTACWIPEVGLPVLTYDEQTDKKLVKLMVNERKPKYSDEMTLDRMRTAGRLILGRRMQKGWDINPRRIIVWASGLLNVALCEVDKVMDEKIRPASRGPKSQTKKKNSDPRALVLKQAETWTPDQMERFIEALREANSRNRRSR